MSTRLMMSPLPLVQRGGRRLRQKQRRLQVGADEIVPVDLADVAERCRIERRGVVDQDIEAAEGAGRGCHQRRQLCDLQQIALRERRGARARGVQLARQGGRVVRGAAVVQHHIRTRRVQRARDGGADASRGAGDECRLARERAARCAVPRGPDRVYAASWTAIMTASAARSMLPPLSPEERRHSGVARRAYPRTNSPPPAAGCPSSASWSWRCMRRGWVTTARAASRSAPAATSSPPPRCPTLFSRCVARQCAQVLAVTGGGILELGAGTGRMAAAVLE